MGNQAFVDGQNLYMNTAANGWQIDLCRFRVYLREKYNVEKAYYFLGAVNNDNQGLYELIQEAGFILVFREHNQNMTGKKKGNVDTDIVVTIMSKLIDDKDLDKVVLVSGDGDYYKMVKYLALRDKLCKLLAPNKHSTSSLYKSLAPQYVDYLDNPGIKKKIEYTNKNTGSS